MVFEEQSDGSLPRLRCMFFRAFEVRNHRVDGRSEIRSTSLSCKPATFKGNEIAKIKAHNTRVNAVAFSSTDRLAGSAAEGGGGRERHQSTSHGIEWRLRHFKEITRVEA
jgi:hypothetical protein